MHAINQKKKILKLKSENIALTEQLNAMQNDLEEIKALLKQKR